MGSVKRIYGEVNSSKDIPTKVGKRVRIITHPPKSTLINIS